jgi:hypothetical protein
VNGAQVPFHIEKFLNNSLFLDVHFKPGDRPAVFQTDLRCRRSTMLLIAVQPQFSTVRWKVLSFFALPCYRSL